MVWVGGSTPHTYTFDGSLLKNSSANATVDGLGYNFIGNPFPSALDWQAASGWGGSATLTNNIYVYNGSTYLVYNKGTQTGTGSRYIAMNQGFFVEATGAGTVTVTNAAATHNAVSFQKDALSISKVSMMLESNGKTDETFVVFIDGATAGYEGEFDAHKLFSFDENYPQIFSTANNNMAINSLPLDYSEAIAMDVRGEDEAEMTISLVEANDFAEVYLEDNYTGIVTDIKQTDYTFTYFSDIEDRFNVFFSVTDIEETNDFISNAYSVNKDIIVSMNDTKSANITVYNVMGQIVKSVKTSSNEVSIPVYETGLYIVTVSTTEGAVSHKVIVK